MDGQSVSLYVGGNPPTKVWPTTRETVQITLGVGMQARDQFRAALTARGLDYTMITEVPFDIELVGTGSAQYMFYDCSSLTYVPALDTAQVTNMAFMFRGCSALTSVPDMDTSQVTDMSRMFFNCSSLTYVPDLDTAQVTNMSYMLYGCSSLTDGNVRLIGKHPNVDTTGMIGGSGLTREPFYTTDGQPWPTAEVHEVSLTDVTGSGTVHPLVSVTVPAGETRNVRIQGTITKGTHVGPAQPFFRIGDADSGRYGPGAAVDFSGTVTAANSTIALVTNGTLEISFTGTVTIEK